MKKSVLWLLLTVGFSLSLNACTTTPDESVETSLSTKGVVQVEGSDSPETDFDSETTLESETSIDQTIEDLDADMESLDIETDFANPSEAELTE